MLIILLQIYEIKVSNGGCEQLSRQKLVDKSIIYWSAMFLGGKQPNENQIIFIETWTHGTSTTL